VGLAAILVVYTSSKMCILEPVVMQMNRYVECASVLMTPFPAPIRFFVASFVWLYVALFMMMHYSVFTFVLEGMADMGLTTLTLCTCASEMVQL
jgi:hypothetical protein